MMKIATRKALMALAIAAAALGWAAPASAQATRTWVSGVGDDVNPCSRTAPCKTFAGAISKTAAGGEINCLDPGGFGAVTITKAMTINCLYTEGGMLAGGNGITVNAGAGDVVYLRGLDIFGVSPPSQGVRILNAAAVHIEDSVIRRFNAINSFGVSFQPSGTTQLFISDTTIAENGNGATGGGILVQPTGAGVARVVLRNVRLHNNANNQLRLDATGGSGTGNRVVIADSQLAGGTNGISVQAAPGTPSSQVLLQDSIIAQATTAGIVANGNQARVRVADTTITASGVGVSILNGAAIETFGNNRLVGNAAASAFTQPPLTEE